MTRFLKFVPALLLAVCAYAAHGAEQRLTVDSKQSQVTVNVFKSGALSGMLHDHDFVPEKLSGAIQFDPANPSAFQLQLTIDAASLRDHQSELSDKDRDKVNSQVAGPEVLDAAKFPTIEFKSRQLALEQNGESGIAGKAVGTLTLHGVTHEVPVTFHGRKTENGWRVEGHAEFNQTDFGIKPVRKAMGTISVKDRVSVDFRILATQSS